MTYLGGAQPANPEGRKCKHFEKYREWLASLGDSLISLGNSLEAVVEMGKTCTFLEIGGTLETSELMEINS